MNGWNHNVHYHELLLAAVPRPCGRALDIGCGAGTFARRLSAHGLMVDALDDEHATIDEARRLSAGASNITFIRADFMEWTAERPYDFISMIAVLHHLPCGHALAKAGQLLQPGGVLAVLGLDRASSLPHLALRGLVNYPVSSFYRLTRGFEEVTAATREPEMTLPEIRQVARALLPGAVIRPHLLWRYSLIWTKPRSTDSQNAVGHADEFQGDRA